MMEFSSSSSASVFLLVAADRMLAVPAEGALVSRVGAHLEPAVRRVAAAVMLVMIGARGAEIRARACLLRRHRQG